VSKIINNQLSIIDRKGVALITVLLIVMAITVLSLGFLSRSDVELACGENVILRQQMDYLAESGLEHARGLILNPQDVSSQYWQGQTAQQIAVGDDYYDVTVVRDDPNYCNYLITSSAYRLKAGKQIGRSSLTAELRLDPCIALRVGATWTSEQQTTVNGDVYCYGDMQGVGHINGDAFASGNITVNTVGHKNPLVAQAPVVWPGLVRSDFSTAYYIGSTAYSTVIVSSKNHPAGSFGPSAGNPAGIRYCSGDVNLPGGVNITGMLVVDGNLAITGVDNTITAVKNFPALLVGGELIMKNSGTLAINGLVQLNKRVLFAAGAENAHLDVLGALFIQKGDIDGLSSLLNSVKVTAAPAIASVQVWPQPGNPRRWSPAGGAFFKSIGRN
jgi:hypothetical protein